MKYLAEISYFSQNFEEVLAVKMNIANDRPFGGRRRNVGFLFLKT